MEDSAVNPLRIPLVIKEVYKYSDFPNKKRFRLVCKTWIDTILDLWRKQTKLVIKHKFHYQSGWLNYQTTDTIQNYFDLYKIGEKPLLNLELVRMQFSFFPVDLLKKEQKAFIKIVSQIQSVQNLIAENFVHLERLELIQCEFLQQGKPEVGFYDILLKSFPKLKALSVRHPFIVHSFRRSFILNESSFPRTQSDLITLNLASVDLKKKTVKRILNLIPNLKNLSFRGLAVEFFEVLSSPLSSGSHILLERLGIDLMYDTHKLFKIPTWIKNYLEAAHPPLKCLKAFLPFGMFPPHWFDSPAEPFIYKPIWSSVRNTLTSLNLRIKMGLWNWCTLFTGSFLPNLTHLCLNFRELKRDVEEDDADDLLHFDFGMLRGTPQLKKLHLELEALSGKRIPAVGTNLEENQLEWRGRKGPIVLEHMRDFRFELYHKPTEGCWRAFAEMMPNLQKLQGMVDQDTEPLVRQLWPDLKLKWSTVLRRADRMRQDGEMEEGTFEFGNAWQEDDWENWEGKRDPI